MTDLDVLLDTQELRPALSAASAARLAQRLGKVASSEIYPRSIAIAQQALFCLGRQGVDKHLITLASSGSNVLDDLTGDRFEVLLDDQTLTLRRSPTTYENAVVLHRLLPYTKPITLGLATSAGCGDRLGLATPGHVRAVRKTDIVPIYAQQSIREMERTERTPRDVISDSTWGVFQEGWRAGYGADADHLKSKPDVDPCVEAGFTFYTFDPRDHVDNDAHTDPIDVLVGKFGALPWHRLQDDQEAMSQRYAQPFPIEEDLVLSFDQPTLLRAACKYGKALAHVSELYRYLAQSMGDRPFEVEVSVDETDTTTSPAEHFFIANELCRLGLEWVSLAPRYVGRFEKGVDYIGDLDAFDRAVAEHAAIARCCGPYKLSIHSGSDKFSIYPLIATHTAGLVHLKTAGTSYLEALRAIAEIDPTLFREILDFSFLRYNQDKATYHVSADPSQALRSSDLGDDRLASVLDNFHNRQMLHVTFGSVLTTKAADGNYLFKDRFFAALRRDEETYYRVLEAHFDRHLEAFA
jgi:hypothetical protein